MKINNGIIHKTEIINDYIAGYPLYELSIKYHTAKDTVRKILVDNNIPIKSRHQRRSILFGKEGEIIKKYKDGLSLSKLAREYGCANKTIRRIVDSTTYIRSPGYYRKSKDLVKYKNGYKLVMVDQNYPKKRPGSWYYPEHILLMEKEIGRIIDGKNENVHHIDLDKSNSDIDNLYLCPREKHAEIHRQLDSLVSILIKERKIIFNRKKHCYEFGR